MAFSSVNRLGQNTKCMKRGNEQRRRQTFFNQSIARAVIQVTSAGAVYPQIKVRQGKNSGWAATRAKGFFTWCSAATDSIGFVPILSVLLLFYWFCSYTLGFAPILWVLFLLSRFCSYS